MNNLWIVLLVFAVGLILGSLFFGGLWLTVKKGLTSKNPGLWFVLSFFLRLGLTLMGFYYIAKEDWRRLLICLFGFLIARYMVLHYTKHKGDMKIKNEKLI